MANHASALKRVRSNQKKRTRKAYQHKTTRTFIKKILKITDKQEAHKHLARAFSMIDKLVQRHIIHMNKGARKKSQIMRHVNRLA